MPQHATLPSVGAQRVINAQLFNKWTRRRIALPIAVVAPTANHPIASQPSECHLPAAICTKSHSEDCIGHWCSHPSTRWCHRIVERWSGTHLQRSQQTTQTGVALPLSVVAPTHHRAIKTEGEGVFLPCGHCCEQSIRGVKNAVGGWIPSTPKGQLLDQGQRRRRPPVQQKEEP